MPCRCDDFPDEPTAPEADYKRAKKELDRLTRLLCYTIGTFMISGEASIPLHRNADLNDWWTKHKNDDYKRLKETGIKFYHKEKANRAVTKKDVLEYLIQQAEDAHLVTTWHKEVMMEDVAGWILDNVIKPDLLLNRTTEQNKELAELKEYERLNKKFKGK